MDKLWDSSQIHSVQLADYLKKPEPQWAMWLKISEPKYLDLLVSVGSELELLLEAISKPKGYAEQQELEERSAVLLAQISQQLRTLRVSKLGRDS